MVAKKTPAPIASEEFVDLGKCDSCQKENLDLRKELLLIRHQVMVLDDSLATLRQIGRTVLVFIFPLVLCLSCDYVIQCKTRAHLTDSQMLLAFSDFLFVFAFGLALPVAIVTIIYHIYCDNEMEIELPGGFQNPVLCQEESEDGDDGDDVFSDPEDITEPVETIPPHDQ